MISRINDIISPYLNDARFARYRRRIPVTLAVAAVATGIGVVGASADASSLSAAGNLAASGLGGTDAGLAPSVFGLAVASYQDPHDGTQPAKTVARQSTAQPATPNAGRSAAVTSKPAVEAVRPSRAADAGPGGVISALQPLFQGNHHKPGAHKASSHPAAPGHVAGQPASASKRDAPAKPYRIYDSVTPSSIPSGHPAAVYSNGNYKVGWGDVRGRKTVLWIDTRGNDIAAHVLDVEPGDATPMRAARWAKAKLSHQPRGTAIIYTMRSQWDAVKYNVANIVPKNQQGRIRYWIADPTGVQHMVKGADATQWLWGPKFDITTANPGFMG